MSYLIPQLITVVVYGLLFHASMGKSDSSMATSTFIVPIATLFMVCPVWWVFYLIELVFYK